MRNVLEREQLIPRPRSEVFAFFADAANLERLTPPSLRFEIRTPPPIVMAAGTVIDYRIALFGVGFGWRTVIESFEPERRFVDVQVAGPYRFWRHEHTFSDGTDGTERAGGTLVHDRVEYEVPYGPLGRVVQALFVRRQVERIFDFRRRALAEHFPARAAPPTA
jgi:ligand-binding SRPBCC domain-containing protein